MENNSSKYKELFTITTNDPEREYCTTEQRVGIDMALGLPYDEIWTFFGIDIRPGSVRPGSKETISFEVFLNLAKKHSENTFNKYNGINENNWQKYI